MEIRNIVQASADVVTITRLSAGDVYKRVETGQFTGTKLWLGVVTSVMNNGDDAAITTLEFGDGYGDHKPQQKVYASGAEVALFDAAPAEVQSVMDKVNRSAADEVDRKRRELAEAEKVLTMVDDIVRHTVQKGLAAPTVSIPD